MVHVGWGSEGIQTCLLECKKDITIKQINHVSFHVYSFANNLNTVVLVLFMYSELELVTTQFLYKRTCQATFCYVSWLDINRLFARVCA